MSGHTIDLRSLVPDLEHEAGVMLGTPGPGRHDSSTGTTDAPDWIDSWMEDREHLELILRDEMCDWLSRAERDALDRALAEDEAASGVAASDVEAAAVMAGRAAALRLVADMVARARAYVQGG